MQRTIESVNKLLLQNQAFKDTKLTICIDNVPILGESQFQESKCSVNLNQLPIYWSEATHAQIVNLPTVLMMCEFWAIHSFNKGNAAYNEPCSYPLTDKKLRMHEY